jgi:hypothetical protein
MVVGWRMDKQGREEGRRKEFNKKVDRALMMTNNENDFLGEVSSFLRLRVPVGS